MRRLGSRRGRNEVSVELFRKGNATVEIAANFLMMNRYAYERTYSFNRSILMVPGYLFLLTFTG